MVRVAARQLRAELGAGFQFCWTDGNELASSVLLGAAAVPSLLVLDVASQRYFLPPQPDALDGAALALFLRAVAAGQVQVGWRRASPSPRHALRSEPRRPRRAAAAEAPALRPVQHALRERPAGKGEAALKEVLQNMFATQPLLSCCLFGLPLGVLSIICYTLCSTDASLDRDEVYRRSDDDQDESDDAPGHDKYE